MSESSVRSTRTKQWREKKRKGFDDDDGEDRDNQLPTVPYRTLPYPTVPYRTLPYPTVPYRTLPYPTVYTARSERGREREVYCSLSTSVCTVWLSWYR